MLGQRLGACVCALLVAMTLVTPRIASADDDDTEGARIHYKAGEQYYLRGHYAQAIGEFKEAYRLSKAPALLYNISQAYERNGDIPNARDHLKKYIDSGDADAGELPALKEKLASLDKRIAAGKEPSRPEPPVKPPVAPAVTPPEDEGAPSSPLKTWKWITLGTGAGLLVLGGLFALDGRKQAQQLEDAVFDPPTTMWTPELDEIYQRGQRDNALAVVCGAAGLALATTGIIFFVIDGKDARRAERAQIVPLLSPGTAGAAAVWRF